MSTLTRRRPPAVARALRDVRVTQDRATPRAAEAARRAAARRRARAAARSSGPTAESSRAPERMQTVLALVGLGAERVGERGSRAGARAAGLRTGADAAWTNVRSAAVWPGLWPAVRITLLEAPAWVFGAAVVVMGLGFVGAGALAAAGAALGPATGPDLIGAVLPGLLVVLLAMAAVLMALYRIAEDAEDQRPVWLIGLAALMLVVS
ncbi:MAG: hypothetical protein QOJ55_1305 [Solirubrobacteraceae bacterium]|nr:hypothetical protein [Solirubrobacteraceae bacterium]